MDTQRAVDDLWDRQPQVIRKFLEARPRYEKLGEEVAYILETAARAAAIEFAAVNFRAKTLDSFCEKVTRKKYAEPLKQVTDIGGVRIVYLYKSDRKKLEAVIEKEFKVIEKITTGDEGDPEKFGYGALHYLVSLGEVSVGARYNEIKDLVCEIQVRTILQDGWAIVANHLSYKQEADVPPELRRKLNALSGLFETADDQFDRVRDERAKYTERLQEEISSDSTEFLDSALNLDNLAAYLAWRLPDRKVDDRASLAELLEEVRSYGLQKIGDIDKVISRASKVFAQYEKEHPPVVQPGNERKFSSVGVTRVSFELADKNLRARLNEHSKEHYREFWDLLDKSS